MFKKISDTLAGLPATVVAGVFLLLDLVPHILETFGLASETGFSFPVSPAIVTIVISGMPLVYLAVWRIIHNPGISKISSALLISIAMLASIAIGDLFAAGEVAFIMAIGAILEDFTTDRAKRGLGKLISLAPTRGRRIGADGSEELIPAEEIAVGDVLRVLPGETVPVDGVILSGETSVDQSVMTGESLPVDKVPGESVFCGTVNRFGSVDIRASKIGEDSSLGRLIRMVKEAENKKAPMARIADKCASWLVPVALLIAVVAGLITKDIVRAVTVLVVFCPCALVLATPTAIMAAIGQATKHGVIIKSGEALEKLGRVDTVAFDKTGTLTYGRLQVSDVIPAAGIDEDGLLTLAAAAESRSEHPLGRAIADYAAERGIATGEVEDFKMSAGRGVSAVVNSHRLFCGSERFLGEQGIQVPSELSDKLDGLREQGKAIILVATDSTCVGVLALSDQLRPDAAAMIRRLKELHVKTVLLTGDTARAASYFADMAGIGEVYSELLPEEKVERVTEMQRYGAEVCMIGDGVNDAPALKSAAVGVAMGSMGSDIAVEAADIALMGDDISKIPYLKRLSLATVRTIKLSITLSMTINVLAVTLSVLGLLTPTTGALVHNAGSCFVVLIAALLYDRKFTNR